jgi:dihydrofolate reductase
VDGGKTIQSFLEKDLIDEMIISTISIILGNGIPLFRKINTEIKIILEKTEYINEQPQGKPAVSTKLLVV